MRVKHRTTGRVGRLAGSEPEYRIGIPTWLVLFDDAPYLTVAVANNDLIVLD